jgi:EAL domain-containing protein (putative c-di-GMP-specific phosphodiesterase class I)
MMMPDSMTIRVVVVDDHQMFAESIIRVLNEDRSIEVVGAAMTGTDGLRLIRSERPDVVLMDYFLPDIDGASVTKQLKQDMPGIKVIVLSGSDRPGAYMAAKDAGCDAWLRKTQASRELHSVIHDVYRGVTVPDLELDSLPRLEELVVHYQPIVSLSTRDIVGFEALVRWMHPTRGLLYPADFIYQAEETGYISRIGEAVCRQAAHQLTDWHHRFPTSPRRWISVNESANGFNSPRTVFSVSKILSDAGLAGEDLILEITETSLLDDSEATMRCFERLHNLGVRLALDDFGTAFSSLSYLRLFPFDFVKIDTSFTAELPTSRRAMLLVEAVKDLASSVSLECIAEGIERVDQESALHTVSWDLVQGYLYSKPSLPADIEVLLSGS